MFKQVTMLNLKKVFILQLLMFIVEIYPHRLFFRGKFFEDFSQNILERTFISPDVQQEWYYQKLNHFITTDERKWFQRYFVNEKYYGKTANSPIFLMVGGEGPISSNWMTGGFWVERAIRHKALLLQLEHRFYGYSRPTEDVSTENLQYLTVEQALHDIVEFISYINKKYNLGSNNKWILFGGSYPTNLVAWLRLNYPHLVYGGISSSGPVLSVVDFQDYFKVVGKSLASYSKSCVRTITNAFSRIDKLSQENGGKQSLTTTFDLCERLEESTDYTNDFAQLNNALANRISAIVQYNKVDHNSNKTIDNFCNMIEDKTLGSSAIERFSATIKYLMRSENITCLEYNYQNFVNYFKQTNWNSSANNGGRQWFFQTCNQMGYFQSSTYKPHIFGDKFPVEHHLKQCIDVFGSQYNSEFIYKQINTTNLIYGGLNIVNNVDRLVFTQGSIDPWHALGITNSTNMQSPAIYITGTAHCADTMGNDYRDLPQLRLARQRISGYIQSWLL